MNKLIIIIGLFIGTYSFANNAKYIESNVKLSLSDVEKLAFEKELPSKSLGYNNKFIWIKLTLPIDSSKNLLEISYPLDVVILHARDNSAASASSLKGDYSATILEVIFLKLQKLINLYLYI